MLCSGGMDSVAVLYAAKKEHSVQRVLSFHYGSKHNDREIPFAAYHSNLLGLKHEIINLGFMDTLFTSSLLQSGAEIPDGHYEETNMKQTVVPFRNGIMLAIATGIAESTKSEGVVVAAHSGDHAIYPDCRELFMQGFAEAMKTGTYAAIQLLRPFISMDKAAVATTGNKLGVDFSKTWSCYKGGDIHCGTCGTCVERREAFIVAGLPDETLYAKTPPLPAPPHP